MPFNIQDAEIAYLIAEEIQRQYDEISLIASENYSPAHVCAAVGSALTNKYAEGLPAQRYYAGCTSVDKIEQCAIDRAIKLFGAEHVNVQPHSGSQANMAIYLACLKPGDTILGMDFAAGGHLSHGYRANFSGILYNVCSYGVDQATELLDYELIAKQARQCRPKLIVAGASAYSRIIDFEKFAHIAASVDAVFWADIAHIAGLVATRLHPNPVKHADFVSSTTHKTLAGPRGAFIMCKTMHAESLDKAVMPGIQGGPFMHSIAGKAICFFNAMQPAFVEYQRQIINNAKTMAQTLEELGYRIVSGGTDNHMFVVDLQNHAITGYDAEKSLERAGITVSRSCIPYDRQKPPIGSGIRIGTAAITRRGMLEPQVITLAHLIDEVIKDYKCTSLIESVKQRVRDLAHNFPVPA